MNFVFFFFDPLERLRVLSSSFGMLSTVFIHFFTA